MISAMPGSNLSNSKVIEETPDQSEERVRTVETIGDENDIGDLLVPQIDIGQLGVGQFERSETLAFNGGGDDEQPPLTKMPT